MELAKLDAFLALTQFIQIKSGHAQEVAFDIQVTAGRAHGWVRAELSGFGVCAAEPGDRLSERSWGVA
jgi:hypothetical protein